MVETLTNLISNIGFPIAMCILLFNQNNKLTELINENTKATNKLAEKIDNLTEK